MTQAASVDNELRAMLPRVNDFASLIAGCKGAYPSTIRHRLLALAESDAASAGKVRLILRTAANPWAERPYWDRRLPLPHPLDDDWRFSPSTAGRLLDLGLAAAGPQRRLLLAAVPTLAMRALDVGLGERVVFAARLDDPVTVAVAEHAGGRMAIKEIRQDMADLGCGAAICDPPWSDVPAQAILRSAASGIIAQAPLFVCVPDVLTGASSAPALAAICDDPGRVGMAAASVLDFDLRYETPFFEVNALAADGIRNYRPDWRTGRLVRARPRHEVASAIYPAAEWDQRAVGHMRVFARCGRPTEGDGAFTLVPSISRTHPSRVSAKVWTSGNRCADIDLRSSKPTRSVAIWRGIRRIADLELCEVEHLLRSDP